MAILGQSLATVGLTLTAVLNIPDVQQAAGRATWLAYAVPLVVILLVSETLVLFRHEPPRPTGIAGYVEVGLGRGVGGLASWALLLGYGAAALACMAFLGSYLSLLLSPLGLRPLPLATFLAGGLASLELARRDVRLSTLTMLLTETLSVLIVLGLCLVVLHRGGVAADLQALDPSGVSAGQVRAGLMVAVLSFMGFESAANLGQEALRPERAVPRALRTAVLVAGGLFLFWAVVLSEGLAWLSADQRMALDPITLLADQLGQTGSGRWIQFGTFLCLFGSSLGSLTAFGRLGLGLAREGVLPRRLGAVHPRFQTPARAMVGLGLPLIGLGAVLVQRGLPPETLYNLFGGVTVLSFLLVYGLVALSGVRAPLAGSRPRDRVLIGSSSLLAVLAVAGGFLWGVIGHENDLLLSFAGLLGVGALLITRRQQAGGWP
jgi:amino acid transporter